MRPRLKLEAKAGDRVRLIHMDDPHALAAGSLGTVEVVGRLWPDGTCNVSVQWDCGSTLALIWPVDKFVVVREEAVQE